MDLINDQQVVKLYIVLTSLLKKIRFYERKNTFNLILRNGIEN